MIYKYIAFVKANGYFLRRRNEQSKYWMYETIDEHLRDSFYQDEVISRMLAEAEAEVLSGKVTSFSAARRLLDVYFRKMK